MALANAASRRKFAMRRPNNDASEFIRALPGDRHLYQDKDPKVSRERTVDQRSVYEWRDVLKKTDMDFIVDSLRPLWEQIDPRIALR
jgi:hypothetical protein